MAFFNKKARRSEMETEKEEAIENPFLNDETEKESTESTEKDLSKLTLAELATLALPYSDRSHSTLSRLSRAELLTIIKNKKDTNTRDAKTIDNDLGDLLEVFIGVLNEIKKARFEKEINPLFIKLLKSQSRKISELFVKIGVGGGILAWCVFFLAFLLIVFDAFFDIKNLPQALKIGKKKPAEVNKNDSQSEKK